MDYIPVYDGDEPDGEGAVKVSPARLQTLGVKTAMAKLRALDAEVRAVGRVEINERAIHDVAPRFEGWIERLHVNASGDPVKRGQPLFSVYSPELVSAQKELAIARELKLDAPDADPARAPPPPGLPRQRVNVWPTGRSQPRRKGRQPPDLQVAGDRIRTREEGGGGHALHGGTAIYRIADLFTVWVIADVYEKDLARVKVGDVAKVTLDAFPDQKFEARLTYLYPTLNAATRTTPVRLELANRDGLLRPGMFAHVDIASAGSALRLTVPSRRSSTRANGRWCCASRAKAGSSPSP